MKTQYAVRLWAWDGEGYEPFIKAYQTEEKARSAFASYSPCENIPQIDLVRQTIDKYECVVDQEDIATKD